VEAHTDREIGDWRPLQIPRLMEIATPTEQVCLLEDGAMIKTWMVKHTEAGLSALFAELALLGDPATMPVAIERCEGRVVDLIAGAGHPVLMVEPAAFKATRRGGVRPARNQTRPRSLWRFLTDYPTPHAATLLSEGCMRQVCRRAEPGACRAQWAQQ
jgi:hypothetical protein